jgi:membrane protease YdiL (CAAX protease family)
MYRSIARDLLRYCLTFQPVLTPKPWKLEAVLRLFLRLFICMCLGWLALAVAPSQTHSGHAKMIVVAGISALCLIAALVLLGKAWTFQNFMSRGLIVLIIFYLGLVLSAWAQHLGGSFPEKPSVLKMAVSMVSLQGAVVILVACLLKEQRISWGEAFGLFNDAKRAVLIGVAAGIIFLPIGSCLKLLYDKGLDYSAHKPPAQQEAVQTIQKNPGWQDRLLLSVFTIILAPVGEELLFRGLLYATLRQVGFPKIGLWVTSIAFAAIHLRHWSGPELLIEADIFLPLVLLAMLLAWLYNRTNNLLAPIVAHATFNSAGLIALFFQRNS